MASPLEDVTFDLDVVHPETLVFLKSQWQRLIEDAALELPTVERDLVGLRNSFRSRLQHLAAEGRISQSDASD